jgi:hypothetical protein
MLSVGVIVVVCVLIGVGLNRLKYLRRSYVVPDIHPIGMAGSDEHDAEQPTGMWTMREVREIETVGSDGGDQQVAFTSSDSVDVEREGSGARRLTPKPIGARQSYNVSGSTS